jgi:hypothetical protein
MFFHIWRLKDTFLSCGVRTCTGVVLWSIDAASAGMYVCLQQSCFLLQCGSFQVAVGAQGRHSRSKVFENGSLSLPGTVHNPWLWAFILGIKSMHLAVYT